MTEDEPWQPSPSAQGKVRTRSNPDNNEDVRTIKGMTGSLITFMEQVRDRNRGLAHEEATVAIQHLTTASMWCVLAATKKEEDQA